MAGSITTSWSIGKKGNTGRYCVKLWSYNNRSCTINRVSGKSSEIER